MIKSLKLKNFRNFENKEFLFDDKKNFIVWKNGRWKTNLLEAISLLSGRSVLNINFESLVEKWKDFFHIEYNNEKDECFSLFYDLKTNKKKFSINGKAMSKKKFMESSEKSVIFSPIIMNMMYLSPNLRRDFLDEILISSYSEYESILKRYKEIVKNRNKVLKNIKKWESEKKEISFWDKKFVESSSIVYKFRFKLIDFLKNKGEDFIEYFDNKVEKVEIVYKTKVNRESVEESVRQYIEKNIDRDIILACTHIWPHVDNFDIILDWVPIIEFASRWETKSTIIWLKLLEMKFIEEHTRKKPKLLIDDLFSELDNNHKNILLSEIKSYQTFITGIEPLLQEGNYEIRV